MYILIDNQAEHYLMNCVLILNLFLSKKKSVSHNYYIINILVQNCAKNHQIEEQDLEHSKLCKITEDQKAAVNLSPLNRPI